MDEQKPWHTLQATALVNEAVVRMFKDGPSDCRDVDHFLALAARAMRSVLVDHARRKGRQKRAFTREDQPLEALSVEYEERGVDLVALDESLKALAEVDAPLAHLVELHFFGRVSLREIARIEKRPRHVVERDWQLARSWLRKHMS
jgi:RNA polymerase sigma factor (TIGR02999 family)